MIGSVLKGTYRILDRVGAGTFATVYLGRNLATNEIVAVKVLKQEYTGDLKFVQRFEREAATIRKLNHPNVVRMLDYGVENDVHFLVMEYVEGKMIADLIRERGPLPVDRAVDIAAQVCQALDAAYTGGKIVHRDIKPQNIMVEPDGTVKVMDFGIAHMPTEATLTQTGMFMGTPGYLSPEVALGQEADIRSDLYALGIVLYEMLTGTAPFTASSAYGMLRHQVETAAPPVTLRRPDVPAWLAAVIARALAKLPAERFQTPADMLAALRLVQVLPPATGRAVRPPGPRPGRPAAWTALFGVAAALLVLGAVLLAVKLGSAGTVTPTAPAAQVVQVTRTAVLPAPTHTPVPTLVLTPALPPATLPAPAVTEATATRSPTPTPTPSPTPQPPTSTPTPAPPTATPTPTPSEPGPITGFEAFGTWTRGTEPNGTFRQSSAQVHEGRYAGELQYDFRTGSSDYVVFMQPRPIYGRPTRLTAWVYGDASKHYLNAWIKDNAGQVWQVPLGRVTHTGWQQMVGVLDPSQPWPWAHISGLDNDRVDFPISFNALVLDDAPDSFAGTGTVFVDDLRADAEVAAVAPSPPAPTARAQPTSPTPAGLSGTLAFAVYNAGIGSYTLYTVKPDGSGLHAVADYMHHPDISTDGKRIVADGVGGSKGDLWSFRLDGTDPRQMTRYPDDRFPVWAPDGRSLGFSSTRQGDGNVRLYIGDRPVKTPRTESIIGNYPLWAANWEFVFNACDYGWGSGSNCGLWHGTDGRLPLWLTGNSSTGLAIPTDAANGEVLFLRPDGNNWEVYRIPQGGGNPVRLTDHVARDGPAAFSPDGATIAFLSDRSGAWALYTMDRQGANVQKRLDLPLGGNYDASPFFGWNEERLAWGAPPAAAPTPGPTGSSLLPAPRITFPTNGSEVGIRNPLAIKWTWTGTLQEGQAFDVRFWHTSDPAPLGIVPPLREFQVQVSLQNTDAFRRRSFSTYYLDVVVVQQQPYKVLSNSARVRINVVNK